MLIAPSPKLNLDRVYIYNIITFEEKIEGFCIILKAKILQFFLTVNVYEIHRHACTYIIFHPYIDVSSVYI